MTDIRQAAQQALEALEHCCFSDGLVTDRDVAADAILAIKQALEQPAQGPVAKLFGTLPVFDTPPAAPSEWPLIKNILAEYGLDAIAFVAEWKAAQRPWVGLTDEEIWSAVSRIGTADSDVNPLVVLNDARAIEAKLKEKNT